MSLHHLPGGGGLHRVTIAALYNSIGNGHRVARAEGDVGNWTLAQCGQKMVWPQGKTGGVSSKV